MYGTLGSPVLLMKSISPSQCFTSVHMAWRCLGAGTMCLPFVTRPITTMNLVFGNSGRLLPAGLLASYHTSIAGYLLPCHSFSLIFWISLAHYFKNISTQCKGIPSTLSKLRHGSQFSNVSKPICNCDIPVQRSISILIQILLLLDIWPMLLLQKPSQSYFLPLVKPTRLVLPHRFGILLPGEFGLLQADWLFDFCTAQVRRTVSFIILILIVADHLQQWWQLCNSCYICFPSFCRWLESCSWEDDGRFPKPEYGSDGGSELKVVGWLTGWFSVGPACTLSALRGDYSCPWTCRWGNTWDSLSASWWRLHSCHCGP